MSSIIVQPGENLADIAVRYLGSLSGLVELAALNGLPITGSLTAGQSLLLPNTLFKTEVAVRAVVNNPGSDIVVQPGQTIADIAIQWCGSASAWAEIASLNGLSMTSPIIPGTVMKVPEQKDKRTTLYFVRGGYKPATGLVTMLEGVDYWFIELDFKVS